MKLPFLLFGALLGAAPLSLFAQNNLPRAIFTDPPRDSAHPARMEVLHIPSGGVKINGVAYVAQGSGRHPTFVFFHGLPGNEKNLDLLQAVRRAGWNAISVNYRGSWGSPGDYRFANNLQDADGVIAFLQDSANAKRLGVETRRMVIAGHSMGGWVVVHTAAHHPELRGAVLISAADMGRVGSMPRAQLVPFMADNMEALAGTTAEIMADELIANAAKWTFDNAVTGLARMPLLVINSKDGLAPHSQALLDRLGSGNRGLRTLRHEPTDHSYSDHRIALARDVIVWLHTLPR